MKNNGIINLFKADLDNEYWIGLSIHTSVWSKEKGEYVGNDVNFNTKAYRIFKNQCVGSQNMTIFKDSKLRDERLNKGKEILEKGGYTVFIGEHSGVYSPEIQCLINR